MLKQFMVTKTITTIILLTMLWVLILASGCKSQNINFNFSGKKVLYSSTSNDEVELVLLNLDTNEEIKFDNFDEVDGSDFLLFNNGKKIFVNSYNSTGKVYIYDVLKDESTEIDIHSKNNEMSDFYNINILNDNFYFASDNKIFAHSLNDFSLVKKYSTEFRISEFLVYDKDLIAVTHSNFDIDKKELSFSNLCLYDFKNNSRKELPFIAYIYEWSADREKLLFNSVGPKIFEYPSCVVTPIHIIGKDSLNVFREMSFIGNDEVIFSGYIDGDDFNLTNLYLLDLKSENILQITNSKTEKEIKSTSY